MAKTILLIEDDSVLAGMYSKKIGSAGFTVIRASNGEEGLDMALKNDIDLVLTDIMLPKLSGTEFIEKFKKHKNKKNVPIVAWSNLAIDTEKENALRLGANEYLVKGEMSLDEIVNTIKKYTSQA